MERLRDAVIDQTSGRILLLTLYLTGGGESIAIGPGMSLIELARCFEQLAIRLRRRAEPIESKGAQQ